MSASISKNKISIISQFVKFIGSLLLIYILGSSNYCFGQDNYSEKTNPNTEDVISFFNSIYNYKFTDAKEMAEGNYPGTYSIVEKELVNANYYWWAIISGENSTSNQNLCNNFLDQALIKLQKIENDKLTESEIFSYIYIYAYKARLEIFNNKNIMALMHLYSSMQFIDIAIEKANESDKYKFISGLYNYFVAYIIDKYPIFYPYFFLFPKGDMKLGISQLKECSKSDDILVRTEALYFLMKINLEFENKFSEALIYTNQLTSLYQNNLIFQYYQFKTSVLQNDTTSVFSKYKTLEQITSENDQLTKVQKNHIIEIAKIDLELHKLVESN